MTLPQLVVQRRNGSLPFRDSEQSLGPTLGEFWSWAYSDLVSNAYRGVLAEFFVAHATGAIQEVRREWDPFDLVTSEGIRVEVKSSAYVQTWAQKEYSIPTFDIAAKGAYDASTGAFDKEKKRRADVYVFGLLSEKDQTRIDPLDVGQWRFFVLARRALDRARPSGQSIRLTPLVEIGAVEVPYQSLSQEIRDQHLAVSDSGPST